MTVKTFPPREAPKKEPGFFREVCRPGWVELSGSEGRAPVFSEDLPEIGRLQM